MTIQNFMVDLLSKQPATGQEIKKPEFTKSSYSQFNNVLSNAINKAPTDNNFVKKDNMITEKDDSAVNSKESKPQYKTFREIAQKDKVETKTSKTDSGKETEVEEVDKTESKKDVKKSHVKDKVAVEALAQIMGIQPQDLVKVLESLNIKPEDLTDTVKTQEVVDKLSGVLNLNSEQKQALSKIFDTLKNVIDEKANLEPTTKVETKAQINAKETTADTNTTDAKVTNTKASDLAKLNNAELTVVKVQDLKEILAKFKTSVEQLTQKLQENPQQLFSQITSEIMGEVSEQESKPPTETTVIPKTSDTLKTEDVTTGALKEEVNPVKTNEPEKSDSKNQNDTKDNQENEPKTAAVEVIQNTSVKPDNGATLQLNNQIPNQVQKVDDISAVSKLHKEAPISKNEIINQVVEKAKVTLTGDKSEMSMDLKPENLGKIGLKVVTERGIVVAKFVAESQQVKETLEASMQVLKDALEKQGLAVQGFSVTVQQDPHKGTNRQNETDTNRKHGSTRSETAAIGTINAVSVLENQKRVSAYNWSDSSINLTA